MERLRKVTTQFFRAMPLSSGISTGTTPNKRIGQALRNLLCGARPYVSIGSLWAICFYCVALGHMFLLVGCGRGARSYVSIMCRWAICLYWLAVGVAPGHMFLLCVCVYVYMCVYV